MSVSSVFESILLTSNKVSYINHGSKHLKNWLDDSRRPTISKTPRGCSYYIHGTFFNLSSVVMVSAGGSNRTIKKILLMTFETRNIIEGTTVLEMWLCCDDIRRSTERTKKNIALKKMRIQWMSSKDFEIGGRLTF